MKIACSFFFIIRYVLAIISKYRLCLNSQEKKQVLVSIFETFHSSLERDFFNCVHFFEKMARSFVPLPRVLQEALT